MFADNLNLTIVKAKSLREEAQLPRKSSDGAIGYDLYAAPSGDPVPVRQWRVLPGERICVPTGVSLSIPSDHAGIIKPRSGMALKFGIDVLGGVIDPDYRGEIMVILVNHGDSPFTVSVGDRIAQIIFPLCSSPLISEIRVSESLSETTRHVSGFGSTGT